MRRVAGFWGALMCALVFTGGASDLLSAIYVVGSLFACFMFSYMAITARQPRSRRELLPFLGVALMCLVASPPLGLVSPVSLVVVPLLFGVPFVLLCLDWHALSSVTGH